MHTRPRCAGDQPLTPRAGQHLRDARHSAVRFPIMAAYQVQLYRAQRYVYRGNEAGSHRHAAFLASAKPTTEATSADAVGGFDHSAVVDCEDEDYGMRIVHFRADGGEIDYSP